MVCSEYLCAFFICVAVVLGVVTALSAAVLTFVELSFIGSVSVSDEVVALTVRAGYGCGDHMVLV
jgi:uncharacterized membrane protein YphA (DoxX/SURF4 family)